MTTSATERVRVIGPGQTYVGKQGFTYGAGASAETVGAQHVCMNILPVPVGGRAKVHYHGLKGRTLRTPWPNSRRVGPTLSVMRRVE